MKILKVSYIVKHNCKRLVENWSKSYIKENYTDRNEYIQKHTDRYANMYGIEQDIDWYKINSIIVNGFEGEI